MRTRLSRCIRKVRFRSEEEALAAIRDSGLPLRLYRCDRGDHFHLTSRTRGKWLPPAQARSSGAAPISDHPLFDPAEPPLTRQRTPGQR